jgi:hypothetical protein
MVTKYHRVCKAHKTNGEPCKAPAMKGQMVCRVHGGSSPQAKSAALRRLQEAADPAAAELVRLAEHAKADGDRLKAIVQVLDRAGIKADISVGESDEGEAEVVIRWRG